MHYLYKSSDSVKGVFPNLCIMEKNPKKTRWVFLMFPLLFNIYILKNRNVFYFTIVLLIRVTGLTEGVRWIWSGTGATLRKKMSFLKECKNKIVVCFALFLLLPCHRKMILYVHFVKNGAAKIILHELFKDNNCWDTLTLSHKA